MAVVVIVLVTPKAAAKRELLFDKLASEHLLQANIFSLKWL
jgi:hypothetical protein